MKFGLVENIIDKIIQVFEANSKVDKALVFGSRAKGSFRPDSDIDIAVKGFDLTLDDIIKISVAIEEKGINFKIDLIDYNSIKEYALTEHIDRVGIEFYSRWNKYRLSELMDLIGGGTPKTTVADYWGGDIPWLSVIDFNNGKKYCFDAEKKITEKGLKESSTKILKKGQIIISARGTVGVIAMLGKDMAFNQSNYGINAKKDLTNNEFLYYLLKSNLASFISASYGAVFDTITKETFNQITVSLPPLTEQYAISTTLRSLDDKIDLLQCQNKNLEHLAETLFKLWFIDKAEIHWERGTVLDLFKLQRGFDLPTQNRIEGKYPIITSSGYNGTHIDYKIKGPGVTTGRSGLLGEVFYIEEDFWPLNTSLFIHEYKLATPMFAYFFLKTLDLKSLNGGSAVPTLNRNDVHKIQIQLPPLKLIEQFEISSKTYFNKIKSNTNQIHTLTNLRDALLPKLMSGELRVKI